MFDKSSGDLLTTCYTSKPGPAGWCATCILNATADHPNFCNPFALPGQEKNPAGAEPTKNWGLCKKSCSPKVKTE